MGMATVPEAPEGAAMPGEAITKTRNAVTCGLIADFSGIIAAILISYLFFF